MAPTRITASTSAAVKDRSDSLMIHALATRVPSPLARDVRGSAGMRVLSLCTGIGGLDLAARLVDPDARTVAYCEIEPFARRILERRMAAGDIDDAPILGDLRHVDWSEWRGRADTLVAGFPC